MADFDVKQTMQALPSHFNAENAKGVSGIVQCIFSGDQASHWVIKIEGQECKVEEGITPNPDLTLKADAEVGVKVLSGEMDSMRAYMLGKVKVFGDLSFGMKLTKLFD